MNDKTIVNRYEKELEAEGKKTRNMLEAVPEGKWDWKPHEKSMTMRQLCGHLAEIAAWPAIILTTSEIDFQASPYVSPPVNSKADLMDLFEESYKKGMAEMEQATDSNLLDETWKLRSGDQVFSNHSKDDNIRHSIAQTIHHRAQLGIFLRLLDVPVPATYGPSADDKSF